MVELKQARKVIESLDPTQVAALKPVFDQKVKEAISLVESMQKSLSGDKPAVVRRRGKAKAKRRAKPKTRAKAKPRAKAKVKAKPKAKAKRKVKAKARKVGRPRRKVAAKAKAKPASGKLPRGTIPKDVASALGAAGSPMAASEIVTTLLKKRAYQTRNPKNFYNQVYVALKNSGLFSKTKKGRWGLA